MSKRTDRKVTPGRSYLNAAKSAPKVNLLLLEGTSPATRKPLRETDWNAFRSAYIKQWFSGVEVPLAVSRAFYNEGAGHLVCENQETAAWFRDFARSFKVESRRFSAWTRAELSAFHTKASVILGPEWSGFDVTPILTLSLRSAGVQPDFKVISSNPTPSGGRATRVFLSRECAT